MSSLPKLTLAELLRYFEKHKRGPTPMPYRDPAPSDETSDLARLAETLKAVVEQQQQLAKMLMVRKDASRGPLVPVGFRIEPKEFPVAVTPSFQEHAGMIFTSASPEFDRMERVMLPLYFTVHPDCDCTFRMTNGGAHQIDWSHSSMFAPGRPSSEHELLLQAWGIMHPPVFDVQVDLHAGGTYVSRRLHGIILCLPYQETRIGHDGFGPFGYGRPGFR